MEQTRRKADEMKNMIDTIRQEIGKATGGFADHFELIRTKAGVHVYRCGYNGAPAVVKCFENEGDRREIANYRMLTELGVPTMKVFALCESCIVMEDIDSSDEWRLGAEEDMADPQVLGRLAEWYFTLHEAGMQMNGLEALYAESDQLTGAALKELGEKLPDTGELCEYVKPRLEGLRALIRESENTLNYNDFYYTNFIVRRDKSAAMMFDYNLMGRGYRYADFRNVESSVSAEAFGAFEKEYGALYMAKYGQEYTTNEKERRIDQFLSPLLGLVGALKRDRFPAWAEQAREDAKRGVLLQLGREILTGEEK